MLRVDGQLLIPQKDILLSVSMLLKTRIIHYWLLALHIEKVE